MKVIMDTQMVATYGYAMEYYRAYFMAKGQKEITMAEMIEDLGFSEPAIRMELGRMEKRGIIRRIYREGKYAGRAKLVGVEVLI